MDSLPTRLAQATPSSVDGTWQRHVAARFADAALGGRSACGRWGTEDSYPVLYLGRPTDSVTVEAYRHLIDPIVDTPAPPIRPRVLVTCEVSVSEILDLRSAANRALAGLTIQELQSETNDKAAYATCQNVSAAAHQLGSHGLIAPARRKWARPSGVVGHHRRHLLFTDRLSDDERPVRTGEDVWVELPPDPRNSPRGSHLRVVR